MKMPIFEKYISDLLEKSTLDVPAWNIEKALLGEKSGWNYIDGCMILALLEIYQATGLSRNYWLRALGWYSMVLLDTLYKCEPGEEYQEEYENLKKVYVDLMDSMLKVQHESGLWYQLPALGGKEPNYLETSGSSIMAYCLLKGVRLGFLPESYRAYGLKAFNGVCDKYLKEKDGKLSLGGICLVAGLGPADNLRRDGSFEYYMSEPNVEDDAKGVGPLLLAYTELRRLGD